MEIIRLIFSLKKKKKHKMDYQTIFKYDNYVWKKQDYLGSGTFGKVYKCKNIKTNEIFAVKVFERYYICTSTMKKIQNEVSLMINLSSPNIGFSNF